MVSVCGGLEDGVAVVDALAAAGVVVVEDEASK